METVEMKSQIYDLMVKEQMLMQQVNVVRNEMQRIQLGLQQVLKQAPVEKK